MSDKMYRVEIADATGHSVVEMTKTEISEKARSTEGTWVFVDDRLVSADEIDNLEMADDASVRLMPGLVGGVDEDGGECWGGGGGARRDAGVCTGCGGLAAEE